LRAKNQESKWEKEIINYPLGFAAWLCQELLSGCGIPTDSIVGLKAFSTLLLKQIM
jgi:hypothetical protein